MFPCDRLEYSPSPTTIREFRKANPDGRPLEGLRQWRGRGRDDYPVEALWGTLLLTFALRLASIEACLAELRRNEALRRMIGINTEHRVLKSRNMSRFLKLLGQKPHSHLLRQIFDRLIRRLKECGPRPREAHRW